MDDIITRNFINKAKAGECVYITYVREAFDKLKNSNKIFCILDLMQADKQKQFEINIPDLKKLDICSIEFVKDYFYARIYNILSTFGGRKMTLYIDTFNNDLKKLVSSINEAFCINKERAERNKYGRCINIIDRMIENICHNDKKNKFCFLINDISEIPKYKKFNEKKINISAIDVFKKATKNLEGKIICGVDVGGTDIKIAVSFNENIVFLKEYDWFPTNFKEISEIIDPISLLIRFARAKVSFDCHSNEKPKFLINYLSKALKNDSNDNMILEAVTKTEEFLKDKIYNFDSIGLCFPDVVIKDKIVGGEVYKTRGIRNNKKINFEKEFKKLTNLDDILRQYCKCSGRVKIINDGPMAAFTAAVEIANSNDSIEVENGVFAHTLGTELGTGWVNENGEIPDIPLDVYNYVIDLGSYNEKGFDSDDLRSINNFNTDLPGTLQKYTSQSGVFRLAVKYFKDKRVDLYKEIFKKGFVNEKKVKNKIGLYIALEPADQRKPFLTYLMVLAETYKCETCDKIFNEVGKYLAIAWLETEDILGPKTKKRVLFGRLVKNKYCFELMIKGMKCIVPDIEMAVADDTIANTSLMKQLKEKKNYSVAQFAQSIGAIYYANY